MLTLAAICATCALEVSEAVPPVMTPEGAKWHAELVVIKLGVDKLRREIDELGPRADIRLRFNFAHEHNACRVLLSYFPHLPADYCD